MPYRVAAALALMGAAALALPAPASAARSEFELQSVTPERVSTPGSATWRLQLHGIEVDAVMNLQIGGIDVPSSEFTDAVKSATITSATLDGPGELKVTKTSKPTRVASCVRGGVRAPEFRQYQLSVPANATTTLVVAATLPVALPETLAGVALQHGMLHAPGAPVEDIAFVPQFPVSKNGRTDGVQLIVGKRKKGRVRVTGRIVPNRGGTKVTFIGRKTQPSSVDRVFGSPRSALAPIRGPLKNFGDVRTKKSGRFRATLTIPSGTSLIARTPGATGGASCGVYVR